MFQLLFNFSVFNVLSQAYEELFTQTLYSDLLVDCPEGECGFMVHGRVVRRLMDDQRADLRVHTTCRWTFAPNTVRVAQVNLP